MLPQVFLQALSRPITRVIRQLHMQKENIQNFSLERCYFMLIQVKIPLRIFQMSPLMMDLRCESQMRSQHL